MTLCVSKFMQKYTFHYNMIIIIFHCCCRVQILETIMWNIPDIGVCGVEGAGGDQPGERLEHHRQEHGGLLNVQSLKNIPSTSEDNKAMGFFMGYQLIEARSGPGGHLGLCS